MPDGKVIIQIDGDDSGLQQSLENIEAKSEKTAKAIGTKTSATREDTKATKEHSKTTQEDNSEVDKLRANYESLSSNVVSVDNNLTQLDADLRLNSAQLGDSATNVDLLKDRQVMLKQALDESRNKVSLLGQQLAVASDLYGENSDEVAHLKLRLTEAKIQEQDLAKELSSTTESLRDNTDAAKKNAEALKSIGTSLSNAGESIARVGTTLTKNVTVPVLAAGTAAFKFASDYEENLNKVDVAFSDSADEVKAWADTATEQFGLSESAALSAASLYGDMATSMGITSEVAADMATELTGLAGDLASFKNIGIDQAMTALNGVFTGETESLKTLGVVMTEINLKEFAAGMGLVYDEMSQAEKVTLRYQYVLAKTANAHGDYARTSDGAANSLRTFTASVENLGAAFGQELLPVITPLIQGATDLITEFGKLDDATKENIIQAAALAAAAGPVLTVGGKILRGVGSLTTALGKMQSEIAASKVGFSTVAGPVGIAVAAGLSFVGVVSAIADAQNAANAETLRASEGLAGINVRTREATAAYQSSVDSINAETASVTALATNLQSLIDSGDRSVETQAQIKSIVNQLNQAVPDLGLAYDELTGKLNMTTDAVIQLAETERARRLYEEMDEQLITLLDERAKAEARLAEAQAEQAEAQAAYNTAYQDYLKHLDDAPGVVSEYKDALNNASEELQDAREYTDDCNEAYNDLDGQIHSLSDEMSELADVTGDTADAHDDAANAADEQAQATEEATQAVAKIGQEAYNAVQSGEDLRDTYEELRGQMDDLAGSGDPYIESLAEQNLKMLEIGATAEELQTDYAGLSESIGLSTTSIAASLVAAGMSAEEFASGAESMRDRVVNSFETISVNEEMTASKIAANLANNLAVHQNWSSNLVSLWNGTQDSTVRAFILYMYDQGPEFATAVSQFANGGSEALASAAESWAAIGDSSTQGYLARVSGAATLAGQTGSEFADFVTDGLDEGVPDAETSGNEIANAVVEGVDSQQQSAQTAGGSLADAIVRGVDSKKSQMNQSGFQAGTQIKIGLLTQKSSIETSASNLASSVASKFQAQNWYGIGYGISSGIAYGVSGGSSLISSAATRAAQNALTSAKKSLGINSPSKVFRDVVGLAIPKGIASGIDRGTPLVENAVDASADAMLAKARQSVKPSVDAATQSYITNNTIYNHTTEGRSQPITIYVYSTLDGREVGRGVAKYVGQEMAYQGAL